VWCTGLLSFLWIFKSSLKDLAMVPPWATVRSVLLIIKGGSRRTRCNKDYVTAQASHTVLLYEGALLFFGLASNLGVEKYNCFYVLCTLHSFLPRYHSNQSEQLFIRLPPNVLPHKKNSGIDMSNFCNHDPPFFLLLFFISS